MTHHLSIELEHPILINSSVGVTRIYVNQEDLKRRWTIAQHSLN